MRLVHIIQVNAPTDSCTLTSHSHTHTLTHTHKHTHIHSESGGSVVTEEVYAFTVRDKCLSGPPPNWGRWRKSLLLDFIGKKVRT